MTTNPDDADDRPRKKRRKKSSALLLVLLAGLVLCLLSAGGIGTGAYFHFRAKPAPTNTPALPKSDPPKNAKLSEQFQGRWQGTSPGRPTLRLRLDVRPDDFTFTATNIVVNEDGVFTHNWKEIRSSADSMLIRQGRAGADKTYDWEIIFKSSDEMSIKSVIDGNILGEYTRVK